MEKLTRQVLTEKYHIHVFHKVIINKASGDSMWYKEYIGHIVRVREYIEDSRFKRYLAADNSIKYPFAAVIYKADCTIVF
jgi:hypothetical protein